jgi:hypothetical protein
LSPKKEKHQDLSMVDHPKTVFSNSRAKTNSQKWHGIFREARPVGKGIQKN